MKRYIARQLVIACLAALALSALCFLPAPVRAQGMPGCIVIFPSVGLAPGQSLRLTLFNPEGATMRAQVQIRHSGGIQVGMGDGSVRFLQAGISETFEFKRSDIPLTGEEGTGRIQLNASISCVRLNSSEAIDPVAASMEIIEVRDGTSNTIFIGEVIPSVPGSGGGRDVLVGGSARDTLMGIVPGQTLRVTLFNTQSSGLGHVPSRVKLFEANGSLIAQSPDLVIPPGTFRSFDFNRDALPLQGELATGRLQVRARSEVSTVDPYSFTVDPRASGLLVASFELIDNSTGKTTAKCHNNLKQLALAVHNVNDSGN